MLDLDNKKALAVSQYPIIEMKRFPILVTGNEDCKDDRHELDEFHMVGAFDRGSSDMMSRSYGDSMLSFPTFHRTVGVIIRELRLFGWHGSFTVRREI